MSGFPTSFSYRTYKNNYTNIDENSFVVIKKHLALNSQLFPQKKYLIIILHEFFNELVMISFGGILMMVLCFFLGSTGSSGTFIAMIGVGLLFMAIGTLTSMFNFIESIRQLNKYNGKLNKLLKSSETYEIFKKAWEEDK